MDLTKILKKLENCPCGRKHTVDIRAVEIGSGLTKKVPEILIKNSFPKNILFVADNNSFMATKGLLENLIENGFTVQCRIYDDVKVADMPKVEELESLCGGAGGVLSVGSGSVNDICRLASYRQKKEFAIVATAPSMDGFASDTAPIIKDNFKSSYQAHQPCVIIADTKVLANAPAALKTAGFGDMIGKCIGLADWKIANITTGEYYCERIANLTREGLGRIISLADKVSEKDEKTAGMIMEALVFTGIAMKLASSSRPASGTEHILSHFWEVKKLERGQLSDYHGRKVGVATVMINKIYNEIAENAAITAKKEEQNWEDILGAYGKNLEGEIKRLNFPAVTEKVDPQNLKDNWEKIRQAIKDELMDNGELIKLMKKAGAPVTAAEIGVDPGLVAAGLKYHPYMRHRITLMRLLPMLDIDTDNFFKE